MRYIWDVNKDLELRKKGRCSFEKVLVALSDPENIIDDAENPKYPGQRMYLVLIDNYPHVVPYEIKGGDIRLITVYPSRKIKRFI